MRTAYPQMQLDTASDDIIMKGFETIARVRRGAEMWTKGFAWDQVAGAEWTVFSDALQAMLEK